MSGWFERPVEGGDVDLRHQGHGWAWADPASRNEARFVTDQKGLPRLVQARLRDVLRGKPRDSQAQRQAAGRGNPGDDGGHAVGHRFFPQQVAEFMFPQASNLNRGAYKKLENEWAAWIQQGHEVEVQITPMPLGQERPDEIHVAYSVKDTNGQTVWAGGRAFLNKNGERLHRFPRRRIQAFRRPTDDVFQALRVSGIQGVDPALASHPAPDPAAQVDGPPPPHDSTAETTATRPPTNLARAFAQRNRAGGRGIGS